MSRARQLRRVLLWERYRRRYPRWDRRMYPAHHRVDLRSRMRRAKRRGVRAHQEMLRPYEARPAPLERGRLQKGVPRTYYHKAQHPLPAKEG